mmetsp:Transcript_24151/g.26816  ORF Transcript_24151/g.26816 Transcript_24151/m.26816 type:complete len:511 (+) Transcript_24151:24-1556(+)
MTNIVTIVLLCLLGFVLAAKKPNFVFFFPDETRAESLGTYGHPLTKTPNYDRLAAMGTVFENAHVQHTQCAPSRCALTTGRYMHVLGHRTQTHLVQVYERNLFKYLKEDGYTVVWLGKNDMFSQKAFPASVTYWEDDIGVQRGGNMFNFGEAGYYSFLDKPDKDTYNSTKNRDYYAVTRAIQFLEKKPQEPWMIFLPGIGAHPPYGAPNPYYSMYSPDEIKKVAPLRPPNIPKKPKYHSPTEGIQYYRNLTSFDDDFFYRINSIYLGLVSYSDWVFGQMLDYLEKSSYWDNTAVIVSSDHGDFSGDFHLVEKWPGGMDDILTHVPLMMRIPDGSKGHRVKTPVAQFDIMSTILDLAGINDTRVHFSKSLVPELKGSTGDVDRAVFSEGGYYYHYEIEPYDPEQVKTYADKNNLYYPRGEEEKQPNGIPRCVMIRKMDYKMVYRPLGVNELYDIKKDPRELNNVYNDPTYITQRAELLEELLEWYLLTGDVTPLDEDPRGLPAKEPVPFRK